ncbi:MAG TPA: ATP-binding protein [Bacteriovoracaceae bacterium]|nr:ATP-binding protein [Bacteriovoracaceae bacterium]
MIFHKFKRSKSSENEIGWGIGLTAVQTMVDNHKGTIRVESDKENGTTFIITIPKATKERTETPYSPQPKVKDEQSVPKSKHH